MFKNIFERVSRLNETILVQCGKATEIQLNAFQRYSEMTLNHLKKISEVRNVDGLRNLAAEQSETLKNLNEQFTADMKAWQEYSKQTRKQVWKAISGAAETAPPKAANAPKSANQAPRIAANA